MKPIYQILFLLYVFLLPIGAGLLGRRLGERSKKFSVIAVLVLVVLFLGTSLFVRRFHAALDDNVGFSIPMDYRDRYMYGFPIGFWCSESMAQPGAPLWEKLANQIDPRAAFAAALFWGHLGLSLCIPGVDHFLRNRRKRKLSNQSIQSIGSYAPNSDA
jgi:hypothetical protein